MILIRHNIAIIRSWRSQFGKIPARDFPDNRCYMTRPKRSVGRVQRGKGAKRPQSFLTAEKLTGAVVFANLLISA